MFKKKKPDKDALAALQKRLWEAKQAPSEVLDLSELKLIEVPSDVFSLCSTCGKDILLVHTNAIKKLPDRFNELKKLRFLDLHVNRLKCVPPTIGHLFSLRVLDVSHNRIEVLPDTLGDLASLVTLNIKGNQIDSLPASLSKLKRLETLDVSSNNIVMIPPEYGRLSGSLVRFDISANPRLTQPPPAVASKGLVDVMMHLCTLAKIEYVQPGNAAITADGDRSGVVASPGADALKMRRLEEESRIEAHIQEREKQKGVMQQQKMAMDAAKTDEVTRQRELGDFMRMRRMSELAIHTNEKQLQMEANARLATMRRERASSERIAEGALAMDKKRTEELVVLLRQVEQDRAGVAFSDDIAREREVLQQMVSSAQSETEKRRIADQMRNLEELERRHSSMAGARAAQDVQRERVRRSIEQCQAEYQMKIEVELLSKEKATEMLIQRIRQDQELFRCVHSAVVQKDCPSCEGATCGINASHVLH
eukprot:Opistho-2@75997